MQDQVIAVEPRSTAPMMAGMNRARSLLPYAPAIPAELRARDQWVCWRYGGLQKNGKRKKLPISALTLKGDMFTQPAAWASFDVALQTAKRHGWGVGYVFAKDDGYVGIDFDGCIVNGELQAVIAQWVALFGSYTEKSISGLGVKVITRGSILHALLSEKARAAGVEAYDSGRFFALTGGQWGDYNTITPGDFALDALFMAYDGAPSTPGTRTPTRLDIAIDDDTEARAFAALGHLAAWRCDNYGAWIRVGMALSELGGAGLALWDAWSQGSGKWIAGDCAKRWKHINPAGKITLGSLMDWAKTDSGGAWSVALWWQEKRAAAATSEPHPAAPAGPWPWERTPADWLACPLCSAIHRHAKWSGDVSIVTLPHWWCRRPDCTVWNKIRAAELLEPLISLGLLFTAEVTDSVKAILEEKDADGNTTEETIKWKSGQWRGVMAAVKRAGGVCLRIPLENGNVMVVATVLDGGKKRAPLLQPVTDHRALLEELYALVCKMPKGRQAFFSGAEKDQAPAETTPSEAAKLTDPAVFASLEDYQRKAVVAMQMSEHEAPTEKAAIARILETTVGGEHEGALLQMCRDAGYTRQGNKWYGDIEAARRLVKLTEERLPKLLQADATRQLSHVGGLNHHATIHTLDLGDGRQVDQDTGEIIGTGSGPGKQAPQEAVAQ